MSVPSSYIYLFLGSTQVVMLTAPSTLTTDNIYMFFNSLNHLYFTLSQYLPKFLTNDLFVKFNNYLLIFQSSYFYLKIPFSTLPLLYSSIIYFYVIFICAWRESFCTHVSSNSSQYPHFCSQPRIPVSFLHCQILHIYIYIYGMLFPPTIHIPIQ